MKVNYKKHCFFNLVHISITNAIDNSKWIKMDQNGSKYGRRSIGSGYKSALVCSCLALTVI